MKPGGTGPGSSGVSLNFDAQALHDAEEREYQREELERHKELQELLTTALDDLSDDDDSQITNDGASVASHESDREQKSEHLWPERPHPNAAAYALAHTSTPLSGSAPPPLVTPAHYPGMPGYVGEAQYGYMMPPTQPPYGYQPTMTLPPPGEERGEGEGRHDEDPYYDTPTLGNGYAYAQHHPEAIDGYHDPQEAGYHDNPNYGAGAVGAYYPGQGYYLEASAGNGLAGEAPYQQYPPPTEAAPAVPQQQMTTEKYVVKYQPSESSRGGPASPPQRDEAAPGSPSKNANKPSQLKDMEEIQRDFHNQGGSPDNRRLGQLQVLYNARGRKIEELDRELKSVTESSEREIRILKHKLALSQDERDGLNGSLSNTQQLLREARGKENEMAGKITALETQISALTGAKEELLKKLQTSESTIENLNLQLEELGRSDSLARARDQHEAIVSGMHNKHEAELLVLKQKLDQANLEKTEKSDEVLSAKRQLSEIQKLSEEQRIERGETINRLTRSLEDSQRQCQQLIESGAGQELSKVKLQLQDVIAGKSIAEDMNGALQDEMKELREQLMMYESASQFGVLPNSSSNPSNPSVTGLDDSYAQLGIHKPQPAPVWRTPESAASEPSTLSSEETVHGLKAELERCLANYRNKRQQLSSTQEELRITKTSLDSAQRRLGAAEVETKEAKGRLSVLQEEVDSMRTSGLSIKEARLQKEVNSLKSEKVILLQEIEELNKRIEEIATSEEQTKQINRELSAQMAQMVREFDDDKQQALDRCEATCLQHHEASKGKYAEQLQEEFSKECKKLVEEFDAKTRELQTSLTTTQHELEEVKGLYVTVCEAKDRMEEEQARCMQETLQQEMARLKAKLAEEKDSELASVKMTLDRDVDVAVKTAKEEWVRQQEGETSRRLEEELAKSKVAWFSEHRAEKEAAVKAAVSTIERHWQQKWDGDMEQEVQAKVFTERRQWEESQKAVFERELAKRVADAEKTWRGGQLQAELQKQQSEGKESELEVSLAAAKRQWQVEQQKGWDEAADALRKTAALEAREDAQLEIEQLTKEVSELQAAKANLEHNLLASDGTWQEQRDLLISEKDAERRKAVEEITEQCEKDYREFLHEHQDTLTKALKSAREQFAKEKTELIHHHEEEMKTVRDKDAKVLEADKKLQQDHDTVLAEHQEKLDAMVKQHEAEKEQLTTQHRHNLLEALEEARGRWQKKFDEAVAENKSSSGECSPEPSNWEQRYHEFKRRVEAQWQEKLAEHSQQMSELREQYTQQLQQQTGEYAHRLEEQEKLLQSADTHLESEVSKLQDELLRSHQEELATLTAKMEASHQIELEEEMARVRVQHQEDVERVRQESRAAAQATAMEVTSLSQQLADARKQLSDLEGYYTNEVSSLQKVIAKREQELSGMQTELAEIKAQVEGYQTSKQDLAARLEAAGDQLNHMQAELHKTKRQRQDLLMAYKKLEASHNQVVDSYKCRHKELAEKVQRYEHKVKSIQSHAESQLGSLQTSLDQERASAAENLKAKMMEMRTNNLDALDRLRKEHASERRRLERTVEALQRKATGVHTYTQTDSELLDTQAVHEIRAYYVDIIAKMRGDVMQHLNCSNERAAETVRSEMVRDRQKTAKRLRKYYMKCLARMLDEDPNGSSKQQKMAAMSKMLDNVPERDSSSGSSSSRSTNSGGSLTRSTNSATYSTASGGLGRTYTTTAARLSPDAQRIVKMGSSLSVFSTGMESDSHRSTTSSSLRDGKRKDSASSTKMPVNFGGTDTDELLNTGSSAGSISDWRSRADVTTVSSGYHSHPHRRPSSEPARRSLFTLPLDDDSRPNSLGSGKQLKVYNQELSSPRSQDGHLGPRKYYDIDIDVVSQAEARSAVLSPREPRVAGFTKLNSDTFLLTPSKSGRHSGGLTNSRSLGDIHQTSGLSEFSVSRASICKSDDALDSSRDAGFVSGTSYRYTPLRQAYNEGTLGHKPAKCHSMPDVADSSFSLPSTPYIPTTRSEEDLLDAPSSFSMPSNPYIPTTRSEEDLLDAPSSFAGQLNRFKSQENLQTTKTNLVRHRSRHKTPPTKLSGAVSPPYRSITTRGQHTRDKGHHVSFKNIDLNSSGDGSDESVKSFASTSTVNSFRDVLKSRSSSSSGQKSSRPLRVSRSGHTLTDKDKPMPRPIAMCTRTTQVPSPLSHKRL